MSAIFSHTVQKEITEGWQGGAAGKAFASHIQLLGRAALQEEGSDTLTCTAACMPLYECTRSMRLSICTRE